MESLDSIFPILSKSLSFLVGTVCFLQIEVPTCRSPYFFFKAIELVSGRAGI